MREALFVSTRMCIADIRAQRAQQNGKMLRWQKVWRNVFCKAQLTVRKGKSTPKNNNSGAINPSAISVYTEMDLASDVTTPPLFPSILLSSKNDIKLLFRVNDHNIGQAQPMRNSWHRRFHTTRRKAERGMFFGRQEILTSEQQGKWKKDREREKKKTYSSAQLSVPLSPDDSCIPGFPAYIQRILSLL